MTYDETLSYLYNIAPMFQSIGAGAYKEGLANTHTLDQHFGHPHRRYRTIHVAGTNGKGSVSHTLAAIMQSAGLRVGLYTSPHMLDFRERIRVNGKPIPEQRVIDFVAQERRFFEPLYPSFFELTTALAFLYFAEQQVDVAIIEVGLGGRLDCTNIIRPDLSIITNISYDHTQFLGNTLPQIAREKAGIIKDGVPVVIGQTGLPAAQTEAQRQQAEQVREVFMSTARAHHSDIRLADEEPWVVASEFNQDGTQTYALASGGRLTGQLGGIYQRHNTSTLLCAIDALMQQDYYAELLTSHPTALSYGLSHVAELTGLQGRWQTLAASPLTICDAAHNPAGIAAIAEQLIIVPQQAVHLVFGMVNDKDIRTSIEALKPLLAAKSVHFYVTQPSSARAMQAHDMQDILAETLTLDAATLPCFSTVGEAYDAARSNAAEADMIVITGSCYLVADALAALPQERK